MASALSAACCAVCAVSDACCGTGCCVVACCVGNVLQAADTLIDIATLRGAATTDAPGPVTMTTASGGADPDPDAMAVTGVETRTCRFSVRGLTCADCSLVVETKLLAMAGVLSINVSCLTFEALVEYDPTAVTALRLEQAINETGFTGAIIRDQTTSEAQQGGRPNRLFATMQVFPSPAAALLSDEEGERLREALLAVPGVAAVGTAKRVATRMPTDLMAAQLRLAAATADPSAPGGVQRDADADADANASAGVAAGVVKAVDKTRCLGYGTEVWLTHNSGNVHLSSALEWEVEYSADETGPRALLAAALALRYPARIVPAAELSAREESGTDSASRMWRVRVPVGVLLSIPMIFLAFIIPAGGLGVEAEEALDHELIPGHRGLSIHTLLSLLLTTPIQFFVGWPLIESAYRAARFTRTPNIDTLVVISSGVAYFYSLAIIIAKIAGAPIAGTITAHAHARAAMRLAQ
jgi:Cu+-exporting ATPase